eukprot:m51a1_g14071 putative 2-amino-3-ketobutyrate CoA ligase (750) ;mRNA; f:1242867-1245987
MSLRWSSLPWIAATGVGAAAVAYPAILKLLELKRAHDAWGRLAGFHKIGLAASALSGRHDIALDERGEVSGPRCVAAVLGIDPNDATIEAWFSRQLFESQQNGLITLPGSHERVQNMSSYGYDSILSDPSIFEWAVEQARQIGASSTGTPAFYRFPLAQRLEDEIAAFLGMEGAVLYMSGYQACVAGLKHFFRRGDLFLHDSLIHASDYEGMQLSRATMVKFNHNDFADCERKLLKYRAGMPPGSQIVIVMESVYSMDGDVGNLPAAADLAWKYGAQIVVDESHGFGVLGKTGRGLEEYWNLPGTVDMVVCSLAKGISGYGGFIAAKDRRILTGLSCNTQLVFSGMMSPFQVAFTLRALETAKAEPQRAATAKANAQYLRTCLHKRGYDTGLSCDAAAIVPVIMDTATPLEMTDMQRHLQGHGYFVFPLYSSAIAIFKPRFRLCGNAHMTPELIDKFVEEFDRSVTAIVGHRNGVKRILVLSGAMFGRVTVDMGSGRRAVLSTIGLGNDDMLLGEVDNQINVDAADGWAFTSSSCYTPMSRVPVNTSKVYEEVVASMLPQFLAHKGFGPASYGTVYFPFARTCGSLVRAFEGAKYRVVSGDYLSLPYGASYLPETVAAAMAPLAYAPLKSSKWDSQTNPAHKALAKDAHIIAGDLGHICQIPDSALVGKVVVCDTMTPAMRKRFTEAGVIATITLSASNEEGLCLGSQCADAMWRSFLGKGFSEAALRAELEKNCPFNCSTAGTGAITA